MVACDPYQLKEEAQKVVMAEIRKKEIAEISSSPELEEDFSHSKYSTKSSQVSNNITDVLL